jgi:hypothetical protein
MNLLCGVHQREPVSVVIIRHALAEGSRGVTTSGRSLLSARIARRTPKRKAKQKGQRNAGEQV